MDPTFCSRDSKDLFKLFSEVSEMAAEYISEHYKEDTKVINFLTPDKLREEIDFSLPQQGAKLGKSLSENGVKELIEKVLKHSVRTGAPRYFNQLWSGTDVANIIGEWITAFTNASTYTYEVSPVYSLMEIEIVEHLKELCGWPRNSGDGVFGPGGALCNVMGMLCARHFKFPHVRVHGHKPEDRPVAFTSEHSHYSLKRGAMVLGIGMDSIRTVPVDENGHMLSAELDKMLEAAKKEGRTPFFVNATAGTTVLGVFDPIEELATVCSKHDVWLHVDGALGASVIMSKKHRHLMKGVDRADSVTWALHKMLGINQQCSVFLTRHTNALKSANSSNADYLFHEHDETPFDLGDKTLSCGRRQDPLKLWLSWKIHGHVGFERRVDRAFDLAAYCAKAVKARAPRFELLFEPECSQVCFWYVPKCAREEKDEKKRREILGIVTPKIRRALQVEGNLLVNYNPLHASAPRFEFIPNFFRIVLNNPEQTEKDVDFVLDEMERVGVDITP